ncbi:amidohydrolase family protein [Actinoplanes sp. NBRC 103695]|uniref:amidohydrolase family protein n=1 Tax=Actinoplanes sp. NBRC 103695 TaxID=3032202 RepID=UPI0024A5D73E|nr:amidohydrolase family protein [Actinoplanes sp. NBRC 103695]GLY97214.1 4-hydroxyphenyl-beta-ketoacyl-CoA hydrolase [Actinoplanes sp. NBRC 103695]
MDIDLESIDAIDMHTHVLTSVRDGQGAPRSMEAAGGEVFGHEMAMTVPQIAETYRQRRMMCVTFMVDVMGTENPVTNDEVLRLGAEHADVIVPFGSVDPRRGPAAVTEARRLLETYDVKGFKFHPTMQHFYPNDERFYPLYEVIQSSGAIAIFHTGQTAIGSGQRGGSGLRLKYSNPIHHDDVAADFPELKIVLAHPSTPWQDEALAVALHKPNVYIDLSGWSPKYFPPQLVQHANTLLKHKVLFGTDFPAFTPQRWLELFDQLPIKPEVRPLILKHNAIELFGWK